MEGVDRKGLSNWAALSSLCSGTTITSRKMDIFHRLPKNIRTVIVCSLHDYCLNYDHKTASNSYRPDLGRNPAFAADGGTTDTGFLALRRCSKAWQVVCDTDKPRTSVHFDSHQQAEVTPFLLSLPHLELVSIRYAADDKEPVLVVSLCDLCDKLPALKGLRLHHMASKLPGMNLEARFERLLLPLSSTLQRLTIDNINCEGDAHKPGHEEGTGLAFLSHLVFLEVLQLRGVCPKLNATNIQDCRRLRKLSLRGPSRDGSHCLNLNACTSLQDVTIINYGLGALDVSALLELQFLTCNKNCIQNLAVSRLTDLICLNCSHNQLTWLDVTKNQRLEKLDCSSNNLSELDLAGLPCLIELMCKSNSISQISLLACRRLRTLICNGARIDSNEIQACRELRCLQMEGNSILAALDFANLPGLYSVILHNCSITALDVRNCTGLNTLVCGNNSALATLLASGCSSLVTMTTVLCDVRSLDLAGCGKLEWLDCSNCTNLARLKLFSCSSLRNVGCRMTHLRTLNVSSSARTIAKLSCKGSAVLIWLCVTDCCKLAELDISGCVMLERVDCQGCSTETVRSTNAGLFRGMNMGQLLAMDD